MRTVVVLHRLILNTEALENWEKHMDTCKEEPACIYSLAGTIFLMMGGKDTDWEKAVPPMAQFIDRALCDEYSGGAAFLKSLEKEIRDWEKNKERCRCQSPETCIWGLVGSVFQMIQAGADWTEALSDMEVLLRAFLCSGCPSIYQDIKQRARGRK